MMSETNFSAGSTSNGLTLLSADELAGVAGGFLTEGEVPAPSTPAPQGGAAMGMKNNWAVSRTNNRHSN